MDVGRITFGDGTPIFVEGTLGDGISMSISKPIVLVIVVVILAAIAYKYRAVITSKWNEAVGTV